MSSYRTPVRATLLAIILLLTACGGTTTTSTGTTAASGGASTKTAVVAAVTPAAPNAATSAASAKTQAATSAAARTGTGATAGAGTGKPVNIAVIVKSVTSDYWKTVGKGVSQASQQDPSIKSTFQGPNEETDIEGQIRVLEAAISQKVSAIAVAPSQANQVQPTLQKAVDAGIPVVLIDTDIPGFTAKTAFVGTDNKLGGQQAGEYIAKQLKSGDKVAIIRGAAGDPVHNLREQGATEPLKTAGITVVAVQPADSDRAKGQNVAENLLTANPDLKAIYATNDEMALGAVQAAKSAGKQIIIVGFDASPDALTAIQSGQMSGSIAQFAEKIGLLGTITAAKVARGEAVEKFVNTGVELVTKDNVSKFKK
ncbi:MAG: hypothetical protein NVS2B7_30000 [Herpetosiphon sp.]